MLRRAVRVTIDLLYEYESFDILVTGEVEWEQPSWDTPGSEDVTINLMEIDFHEGNTYPIYHAIMAAPHSPEKYIEQIKEDLRIKAVETLNEGPDPDQEYDSDRELREEEMRLDRTERNEQ